MSKPFSFADLPPERRREIASKGGKKGGAFRSMTPERRREIASRGGKAVQEAGKAHHWTSEEARAAGKIGGPRSKPYTRKPKPPKPEKMTIPAHKTQKES
jgi:uncharacterized protein